jgi:hypothetical protein
MTPEPMPPEPERPWVFQCIPHFNDEQKNHLESQTMTERAMRAHASELLKKFYVVSVWTPTYLDGMLENAGVFTVGANL